jgi:ABC-type metal ion transport system, periplasmic component/surface antigen
MINTKKLTAGVLALGLFATVLTGCGSNANDADAAKTETEASKVIKIGASPSPHEEILNALKDEFTAEGYTLEVVPFSDYVLPNKALANGELDANYFQHLPYLEEFNKENKLDLVSAGPVHYEPMAIFKGKTETLSALKDGAKIAVPNDTTNEARALLLLQDNGFIKLDEKAGLNATKKDIVDNPKNFEIVELEAAQIPRSLGDVDIAVINGNYAISAGLNLDDALAKEEADSLAAKTYANIIAVRAEDKDSEKTKAIMKVLVSPKAVEFINKNYKGAVVASK